MHRERLLLTLAEVGVDVAALGERSYAGKLRDYGLDSLATVRLALRLEEIVGVLIPDHLFAIEGFATLADVEQLVDALEQLAHQRPT